MKSIVLIFLLTFASCSTLRESQNILRTGEFAIPLAAKYFVACDHAVRSECGFTLSDCSDLFRYECTENVAIINMEALNPGNRGN